VVNLDAKTVEVRPGVSISPVRVSKARFLALHKGTTLTKEMFLNHLYGGMDEPELKIIDVLSASCARSSPMPRVTGTILRPFGAMGTCCASRKSATEDIRLEVFCIVTRRTHTGTKSVTNGVVSSGNRNPQQQAVVREN
jgi:hypothetical protein